MKKHNLILTIGLLLLLLVGFEASAQKRHTVMFYNVENLFDTLNDPDINDEEFLPSAAKAWNTSKYLRKLQNIEQVLQAIVEQIPSPTGDEDAPLKALIFDSYYDQYKGVIVYVRVKDGVLKPGDTIRFMATNKEFSELLGNKTIVEENVNKSVGADGKEKQVERKIFPGYVLVKMVLTDESWYVVRNIRGCTGFVGPSGKPVPLTEKEIAALGVEKKEIVVNYNVGDTVKSGTVLVVLEAMKMENEIMAPKAGTVAQVVTSKGASVNTGDVLVVIA